MYGFQLLTCTVFSVHLLTYTVFSVHVLTCTLFSVHPYASAVWSVSLYGHVLLKRNSGEFVACVTGYMVMYYISGCMAG